MIDTSDMPHHHRAALGDRGGSSYEIVSQARTLLVIVSSPGAISVGACAISA
jgi:hypothetical protein